MRVEVYTVTSETCDEYDDVVCIMYYPTHVKIVEDSTTGQGCNYPWAQILRIDEYSDD